MTDEHLIWADMRQHRDGEVRVYAKGPGLGRLVSGTYAGDIVGEFDSALAELAVLRAQRDAALAEAASFTVGWEDEPDPTPEYRHYAVAFKEAARRVRAALGVQPEPADG